MGNTGCKISKLRVKLEVSGRIHFAFIIIIFV